MQKKKQFNSRKNVNPKNPKKKQFETFRNKTPDLRHTETVPALVVGANDVH